MNVIKMYSEKHNKDMWWVECEASYYGPYNHKPEAEEKMKDLLAALNQPQGG